PLMDAAIAEGYDRILAENQRWPWLEDRWSVVVPAGTDTVSLTQAGDTIREVVSLRVNGEKLQHTDEDTAAVKWGTKEGSLREWSRWSNEVNVWPTPVTNTTVEVQGYREPRPFESLGGWEPDLPREMHWLVLDWALANEFQRLEDVEMAMAYRAKFDTQLRSVKRQVLSPPAPLPLVVGGDGARIRNR